jgi:hypothetical protein
MPGKVETKHEMLRAGYTFRSKSTCKSCAAPIEWWRTNNGKNLCFDPLPANEDETTTVHWATCPNADQHRKSKQPTPPAAPPSSLDGLQHQIAALRARTNARAIVAIFDEGSAASWRNGIPGEDLRQELITEANNIRTHLNGGPTR